MIKVSIIVPVYNVEAYLKKCLDSLINQTLEEIEIIVVNDGTKDNSQVIIDEYVKKDRRIKSFIKENGGLSDARNYGIKKAKGEYIGFVDSDDYVNYDMFEKMYQKAEHEDLDIVVCGTNVVFSLEKNNYKLRASLDYSNDNVKNYITAQPMACTRIIKKRLFDDDFLFKKGILYEDLCLMPTFALETKKIGFVEEALYNYFQRESSIMNQNTFNEKLNDIFRVLEIIKNKYVLNALYLKYQEEIDYLYITHLLRSASLRFIDYDNYEVMFKKIIDVISINVPNWKDNIYYKKSSFKFKTVCNLAFKRKYSILKLLKKVGG